MAYQIRVVAPDGKLSTGHLLTIKRSLDNEGVNLSGIEIEWAENGMDEEFRMIWARISREIG
jgi:hypothetical protein